MPAVSIVVTCYNYGPYLREALDSVVRQTWTDYEVIIVDDGSTDETPAVAAVYAEQFHMMYVRQENMGQAAAKNIGIQRASSPWIAFLDADDVWLPRKLELQLSAAGTDSEIGVVYTDRMWVSPSSVSLEMVESRRLVSGNILPNLFEDNIVCFSSSLVRRECFMRHGLMDRGLRLGIDFDLWLRIAREYRFVCVPQQLVRYRTGHANLSQFKRERYETALFIMRRFLDEYGGRELLPAWVIKAAFATTYANYAWYLRSHCPQEALRKYADALSYDPVHLAAWKGLLRTIGVLAALSLRQRMKGERL